MEENPFENGGMPAESSKKEENGFLDGFTDIDALGENPFDSDGEEQDAVSLPIQQAGHASPKEHGRCFQYINRKAG